MSKLEIAWLQFINRLNEYEFSRENLLKICLDFRAELSKYFKKQNISGSSEDLITELDKLNTLHPLPQKAKLLKHLEGINIALVDYNRVLCEQDHEDYKLIQDELGHTMALFNQITPLMAGNLYSSRKKRLLNSVKNPSSLDQALGQQFVNELLEEAHQLKLNLKSLNAAIEDEAPNASELFMQLWANPIMSTRARSLLVHDEELCEICFDNYKLFFLKLIEPIEVQHLRLLALDTDFVSFFAKQRSVTLIQRSKNSFLQSNENIRLLDKQQLEIEAANSLQDIATSLDALSSNYTISRLSFLINILLACFGCSLRPRTVREAQEMREIVNYLEGNASLSSMLAQPG